MKALYRLDNNEQWSDNSFWYIIAESPQEAMDLFVQSKGGFYDPDFIQVDHGNRISWRVPYNRWRKRFGAWGCEYLLDLVSDTFEKGVYT